MVGDPVKTAAPLPPPAVPVPVPFAKTPGLESAPAVLREMEKLIDARFGPGRHGMGPLLEELEQGLRALVPGPGDTRLTPEAQAKARAGFAGTVDTLEDVLEALHRAGHARGVMGWGER